MRIEREEVTIYSPFNLSDEVSDRILAQLVSALCFSDQFSETFAIKYILKNMSGDEQKYAFYLAGKIIAHHSMLEELGKEEVGDVKSIISLVAKMQVIRKFDTLEKLTKSVEIFIARQRKLMLVKKNSGLED